MWLNLFLGSHGTGIQSFFTFSNEFWMTIIPGM
jgi:hypothetical protein